MEVKKIISGDFGVQIVLSSEEADNLRFDLEEANSKSALYNITEDLLNRLKDLFKGQED